MSNELVGLLLMAAPILYWCAVIVRAMANRRSHVEVDVVVLVVSLLCWMAGRVIAGKSMVDFLL